MNPIFAAIDNEDMEQVITLIDEQNVSPDEQNHGFTPLLIAALNSNWPLMRILLDRGANPDILGPGKTNLIIILMAGVAEVPNDVLERVFSRCNIEFQGPFGRTALMWAARTGKIDCVRRLIHHGADVNTSDSFGMTPLTHAAANGRLEACQILIEEAQDKTDMEIADQSGSRPLKHAVLGGHVAVVKYLLDANVQVDPVDKMGRTPLLVACGGVSEALISYDIIRLLIKAGSDPRLDFQGTSPIDYAKTTGSAVLSDMYLAVSNATLAQRIVWHIRPLIARKEMKWDDIEDLVTWGIARVHLQGLGRPVREGEG